MSLGSLLFVVLILMLFGVIPTWPHSKNCGYYHRWWTGTGGAHPLDAAVARMAVMGQRPASVKIAHWRWRAPWIGVAALTLAACGDMARSARSLQAPAHRRACRRRGSGSFRPSTSHRPRAGAVALANRRRRAAGTASPAGWIIRAGSWCCPMATCWSPRPMRRPARGRQGHPGLGDEAGDEAGRRGRASADRITLLRDTDGDGVAEQRSSSAKGLNSPFGMALVGARLCGRTPTPCWLSLRAAATRGSTRLAARWSNLPAGPINHHWTKNMIASPDGRALRRPWVRTAMWPRTAWTRRRGARRSGQSTSRPARTASLPPACAIPTAWPGNPERQPCGRSSTNATSSATTWFPTT